MIKPTGMIKCSFCQQPYIIGQERVITNGMGTAYICKPCVQKFKKDLHVPTPPPLPSNTEEKDPA